MDPATIAAVASIIGTIVGSMKKDKKANPQMRQPQPLQAPTASSPQFTADSTAGNQKADLASLLTTSTAQPAKDPAADVNRSASRYQDAMAEAIKTGTTSADKAPKTSSGTTFADALGSMGAAAETVSAMRDANRPPPAPRPSAFGQAADVAPRLQTSSPGFAIPQRQGQRPTLAELLQLMAARRA